MPLINTVNTLGAVVAPGGAAAEQVAHEDAVHRDMGEDRIAVVASHDELSESLSLAPAAARIASRHTAGLLYPRGGVAAHVAPYRAEYAPNYAIASKAIGPERT